MGFSKIVGHKRQIEFLKKAIVNNHLSHGYIFDGEEGLGRRLVAIEFIKAVYCLEHENDACGVCANCVKIDTGNHPDLLMIEPEGNSIKNKQVEELQSFISMKPYESSMKTVIVARGNTMTTSAQNRLLKVLEEPAGEVMIIIISENVEGLLPTIKSRCQRMRFNKLSREEIEGYISKNYSLEQEDLTAVAIFSEGSIGKAVEFVDSDVFQIGRKNILELIYAMHKKDLIKVFEVCEIFEEQKENILQLLDFMILLYRDILFLNEVRDVEVLINFDLKEDIKALTRIVPEEKIIRYIDLIEECKSALSSNVNTKIAIETLLFNIQEA